jgi:hypothetical protein
MKLIRVPLGSTLNDKTKFVSEFLRVFPLNTKGKIEDIWTRQVSAGVLQIIIDVETGFITQVMRISENGGTYWDLSSRFLNQIPLIYEFKLEDIPPPLENGLIPSTFTANTKVEYNIDELLDIISEKGYAELSDEQKSFLAKFSKK